MTLDHSTMLEVAYRTLSGRVPIDDLDDAVQEAVERMWIRGTSEVAHAIRISKDAARRPRLEVDELEDIVADGYDLEHLAEQRETIAQFVTWAMSSDAGCVSLLSVLGFADGEIAEMSGRSRRTVLRSRCGP